MTVAVHNLMSNATVDTTEYIPISELETIPLITICSRQTNSHYEKDLEELIQKTDKFGYLSESNILSGRVILCL